MSGANKAFPPNSRADPAILHTAQTLLIHADAAARSLQQVEQSVVPDEKPQKGEQWDEQPPAGEQTVVEGEPRDYPGAEKGDDPRSSVEQMPVRLLMDRLLTLRQTA
jgi:hypothetical protein